MTTIAPPTPATIKFTGLSPKTTQLLRSGTTLQQKAGTAKIGRTIATFEMSIESMDLLLDHLIEHEITGSGASSPEVKRLRGLRRDFANAKCGQGLSVGVTITQHVETDPVREQLLDALAAVWHLPCIARTDALDDLAGFDEMASPSQEDRRAWLAEHL